MYGSKLDNKNIELAKLLVHLRNHIDIHRIIGLNIHNIMEVDENPISLALLWHVQASAHELAVLYICKIFERQRNTYELCSISGIIESVPADISSEHQRQRLEEFGEKYGNKNSAINVKEYLAATFKTFCNKYSGELEEFKSFRDKIGAHKEYGAIINSLPSHDARENLFSFAKDFYDVVSRYIVGVGPATFDRKVGKGAIRLMKSMGIKNPRFDFDDKN